MDGRVNVRVVTRNRIGGEEETLRFAGEGVLRRRPGGFVRRRDTRQKCIQFRFGHFGHPFVLLYRSAARTKRPGRGVPAQYKCGKPA